MCKNSKYRFTILHGGNNYYRLRDLAAAFRGTSSSFDVTWNGETKQVEVLTGRDYTGEAESGGLSWWGAQKLIACYIL